MTLGDRVRPGIPESKPDRRVYVTLANRAKRGELDMRVYVTLADMAHSSCLGFLLR